MQFDPCVFDLQPTCLPLDMLTAPYRIAFGHLFEIWEPTHGICERITHLFLFVIELIPGANYLVCYLDYVWTVDHFQNNIDDEAYSQIYEDRHFKTTWTPSEHGLELHLFRTAYFDRHSQKFSDATAFFSAMRDSQGQMWAIQGNCTTTKRMVGPRASIEIVDEMDPLNEKVEKDTVLGRYNSWKNLALQILYPRDTEIPPHFDQELTLKIVSYYPSIESLVVSMQLTAKLQLVLTELGLQEKISEFNIRLGSSIKQLEEDLAQITQGSFNPTAPTVTFKRAHKKNAFYQTARELVDSLKDQLGAFLKRQFPDKDFTSQLDKRLDGFRLELCQIFTEVQQEALGSQVEQLVQEMQLTNKLKEQLQHVELQDKEELFSQKLNLSLTKLEEALIQLTKNSLEENQQAVNEAAEWNLSKSQTQSTLKRDEILFYNELNSEVEALQKKLLEFFNSHFPNYDFSEVIEKRLSDLIASINLIVDDLQNPQEET